MTSRLPLLLRAACLGFALAAASAMAQEPRPAQPAVEASVGADKFERGTPVPAWVEQYVGVPTTQDKSPVVVLLADTQQLVADEPAHHVHRMMVANAASGIDQVARFSIEFNPAYQRVQLHALRVLRGGEAQDRLQSARTSFLQRETELDNGVYTGNITASILINDLRVGDVLESRYTVTGQNPVLAGRYVRLTSWDDYRRTEVRRVTLWHPENRRIGWTMRGDGGKGVVQPQESVNAGMRKLRWEAAGLARTDVEPRVPADYDPFRYLQFSEFRSWGEVNAWAQDLFRPAGPPAPELQQVAAQFMQKPSEEERVSAALSWVQKEVRYFSLSLGESSHRPAPALVTLQRRYGDCKDKSALLIELLRAMGLQAQPVLVSAQTVRGAGKGLPTPYAFDHAIVRAEVNGKVYFLDPTRLGQGGQLSAMGQAWGGAEVLVVQGGNDKFTTVPEAQAPGVTRADLEERITVSKLGGEGELSMKWTRTGVGAESARIAFAQMSNERLKRFLLEPYEKRYPGAMPIGDVTLADDPEQNRVIVIMKLKLPALSRKVGDASAVNFRATNFDDALPLPSTSVRTQPFALPYSAAGKYSVDIEFPPTMMGYSTPVSAKVHDDAFDFSIERSNRDNKTSAAFEVKVLQWQVDPDRLPAYAATARRVEDVIRGTMYAVGKAQMPAAALPGGAKPAMQLALEKSHLSAVERLSRSIDSGRLKGDDLALARCERAYSMAILGMAGAALVDATQAVETSPHLAATHACRGVVLSANGDMAQAVPELTSAIVLDPDQQNAYSLRAHARFYLGQLAQSAEDYAQAQQSARNRGGNSLNPAIWRAMALQRLGQPHDPALLALAGESPRGAWPRPVLAMLHGLIPVDEMIGLAQLSQGDARDRALTEAYFYAGQWSLQQGDSAKAADYFRKTLGMGYITFVEHRSAVLELAMLGGAAK